MSNTDAVLIASFFVFAGAGRCLAAVEGGGILDAAAVVSASEHTRSPLSFVFFPANIWNTASSPPYQKTTEAKAAPGGSAAAASAGSGSSADKDGGASSSSKASAEKGPRIPLPRPGTLAPPPQLVVVPSWAMAKWHMELTEACPRLVVKVGCLLLGGCPC